MSPSTLALLLLTPLLVWRVYSRLKTMMARQRSIQARHWTGLTVFFSVLLIVAADLLNNPASLAWLAIGVAAGVGYAVWGLRLTKFESTAKGYFFQPNARLGIMVAMLFFARVLYIGFDMYAASANSAPAPRFTDSALSLLSLGLAASYFGTYSAGLLRWRRKVRMAEEADE